MRVSVADILGPAESEPVEAAPDPMDALNVAGADLVAAIEKKDARAVASALHAAFRLCESMPGPGESDDE
jgi:hypothetical protein